MSLILEALRKSEAERRRAQVPDLLTEPQAAAPVIARATPRWPLWLGGAVVVLAVAWFTMTREAVPPSDDTATVSRDADPVDAPQPANDAIESPSHAPARPAPALQRPLVVAAPTPATPAATTPPPAPDTAPRQVASTPTAMSSPPARAEPIAPPPPAPTAAIASPHAVERLADLGNAERKQLPPLKLSMHMWNDVAEQRVVIIDGARLGVGDRLGAVVIADIVPDGVLLDWNGRALKLPLR